LGAALVTQYLRRLREIQRRQERQLQTEKLEAIGLLTSAVAHDTANLLAIVGNATALIGRLIPGNADVERALAVTTRAVEHGRQMLAQLTSFASQRSTPTRAIEVDASITRAVPLLKQALQSGVNLHTDLAAERSLCLVDETQLCVALVNLMANARDAMNGTGEVRLSTRVLPPAEVAAMGLPKEGAFVGVCVEDNGRGMSSEVQRRAFDPFFTTKGERGTGLGLAQVYGFVKRAGGEVQITSRLGSGTQVQMLFPLALRPAGATAPAPGDLHTGSRAGGGGVKRPLNRISEGRQS
jgi:signal transduction histidine kinase